MSKAGLIGGQPEKYSGIWSTREHELQQRKSKWASYFGYTFPDKVGVGYQIPADIPEGAQPGDLLIVFCVLIGDVNATYTVPDFTAIINSNATYCGYISNWDGVKTRYFLEASVTTTASRAGIIALRNYSFDVASAIVSGSTPTPSEITVSQDNSLLFYFARVTGPNDATGSNTPPAGFTTLIEVADNLGCLVYCAFKEVDAGGSGTFNVTCSASTARAWSLAVNHY
jgi:hypothetical protein